MGGPPIRMEEKDKEETVVMVPTCRGQLMYSTISEGIPVITTFRMFLEQTPHLLAEEEFEEFDAYLRTDVKYASCTAPGVCAYGGPDPLNIIKNVYREQIPLMNRFYKSVNELHEEYTEFIDEEANDIEIYNKMYEHIFQAIRGIPFWAEYELSLDFPNKIQRFFVRNNPTTKGQFKMQSFDSINPTKILTNNTLEAISLVEILVGSYKEHKKVHYFDSCCSKLLQEPSDWLIEGSDETRFPIACRPYIEIEEKPYILPTSSEFVLTELEFEVLGLPRPKVSAAIGGKRKRKRKRSRNRSRSRSRNRSKSRNNKSRRNITIKRKRKRKRIRSKRSNRK
jgi:hypothetical protein